MLTIYSVPCREIEQRIKSVSGQSFSEEDTSYKHDSDIIKRTLDRLFHPYHIIFVEHGIMAHNPWC